MFENILFTVRLNTSFEIKLLTKITTELWRFKKPALHFVLQVYLFVL